MRLDDLRIRHCQETGDAHPPAVILARRPTRRPASATGPTRRSSMRSATAGGRKRDHRTAHGEPLRCPDVEYRCASDRRLSTCGKPIHIEVEKSGYQIPLPPTCGPRWPTSRIRHDKIVWSISATSQRSGTAWNTICHSCRRASGTSPGLAPAAPIAGLLRAEMVVLAGGADRGVVGKQASPARRCPGSTGRPGRRGGLAHPGGGGRQDGASASGAAAPALSRLIQLRPGTVLLLRLKLPPRERRLPTVPEGIVGGRSCCG